MSEPQTPLDVIFQFAHDEITLGVLRSELSSWVWRLSVGGVGYDELFALQLFFAEYDRGHRTEQDIRKAARGMVFMDPRTITKERDNGNQQRVD